MQKILSIRYRGHWLPVIFMQLAKGGVLTLEWIPADPIPLMPIVYQELK